MTDLTPTDMKQLYLKVLGRIAQLVTCLATDVSCEFDPGRVPYFRGDYEIISTVILLPSAESFKKDCCQLQAKVFAQSTG